MTVPPGVMPGQAFVIQTPVGQMQVTVPPDGVPGMPMTVMVPATVQPTMAAPVPMAMELQPVAMGIVLDTGVAQPMAGQPVAMQPVPQAMMMAPTPAMGTWPVEFKIDHKDGAACEALKSAMPVSLHSAGVTQNEWGQIVDLLHGRPPQEELLLQQRGLRGAQKAAAATAAAHRCLLRASARRPARRAAARPSPHPPTHLPSRPLPCAAPLRSAATSASRSARSRRAYASSTRSLASFALVRMTVAGRRQ